MKVSHDRGDESPEAKTRWFQSLTLEERMDLFVSYTNLILSNNPDVMRKKRNTRPDRGHFQAITRKERLGTLSSAGLQRFLRGT